MAKAELVGDEVEKAFDKVQEYMIGSVAIGYLNEARALYRKQAGAMNRKVKRLEKQLEKAKQS